MKALKAATVVCLFLACGSVAIAGSPGGHTHDASQITGTLVDSQISDDLSISGLGFIDAAAIKLGMILDAFVSDVLTIAEGGDVHGGAIKRGIVAEARIDGLIARVAQVMTIVLANDGPGSGLIADRLDDLDSTDFARKAHTHDAGDIAGQLAESQLPASATTQGNEFNAPGKLVRLNDRGKVPSDLIDFPASGVPVGAIIMWSGTAIPTGWALCDGTNGRPDLRDRFIVGASATKAVNSVGGSASHNHTGSTGPADGKIWIDDNSGGTDYWSVRDSHTHTVTTNAASSLPPYYALAFIIKTAP